MKKALQIIVSTLAAIFSVYMIAAAAWTGPTLTPPYGNLPTPAPIASPTFTGTVSGITSTMVGLGNVTNESKATMFTSPTFTGSLTMPGTGIWNSSGLIGVGTAVDTNYKITTTAGGIKAENNDATNPAGYFKNSGAGPSLFVDGTIKIAGGTPGAGKVLTSDASGLASWATSASNQWTGTNPIYYTAGNVGIGTTNPLALLNTYKTPVASTYVQQFRIGGTGNYPSLTMGTYDAYDGYIATDGNDLRILSGKGVASENHNIHFYTGFNGSGGAAESNERMTILYNGNVGIGTPAPGTYDGVPAKMEVKSATLTGLAINSSLDSIADLILVNNDVVKWHLLNRGGTGVAADRFELYAGGLGAKVAVQQNGYVGIGTVSPGGSLEVASTGNTFPGSWNNNLKLTGAYPTMWFHDTTTNDGYYFGQEAGILYVGREGAGSHTGYTMVLDGSGGVGIGTQAPGYKLDVQGGDINASGKLREGGNSLIPAGAVMYFNLAACPAGWTELTAARGRYVVGLPSSGTLAGTVGTALTNTENRPAGGHTHTINDPGHSHPIRGSANPAGNTTQVHIYPYYDWANEISVYSPQVSTTGISINSTGVTGTNAPYIQLLVCQKS